MNPPLRTIRLDADSRCQLHCPLCPTGDGRNRKGVVGAGYLTLDRFRRILDLNPSVMRVELSNWGEICLNPELIEIMKHAHSRSVALSARNGVNFNHAPAGLLEAMVIYNFRHLTVSIDGASQEVYGRFRQGGTLANVLSNIRTLIRLRTRAGAKYPELRWQFIAFGHNEHEIVSARCLAAELGMSFYVKFNATPDYSPVRDTDLVARESGLGVSSRAEFRAQTSRSYSLPCTQLMDEPQVNWDGTLLGCCRNATVTLGDALAQPLTTLQKSHIYQKTLQVAGGIDKDPSGTPCETCGIYRTEIRTA